ncbi:putative porin [Pseudomonas citronellolis]|uniref:Porin n=1 Tax=Pseudomonas citronellolis TaxID=53408 RepID=A0AAW6P1W9_9PSED|nr:putative porin [Pseudomonas citronellolis]MDF3840997.1 putative porin [Pseudomonas citronellolis]
MRSISALGGMGICAGALLVVSVPAQAGVDARLLEMLKANGSISAAQYTELTAELDRENQAAAEQAKAKKEQMSAFEQSIAWAARTQVKGDVRVRQETVHAQNSGSKGDQNRQRIRARVGFYSQINPQVDTGIRIATGSGDDARSTNQSMDNYFDKKQLWLDQAYIDFHPAAVKNLHLIGGKMNQPWVSAGDVIWDGDINPEGFAATYKYLLGGSAELFGSAGYFNLKDNVDGEGYAFQHDLRLYSGQFGARFAPIEGIKATLGASLYAYDNDTDSACGSATTTPCQLSANGNTTRDFRLYEGFGQLDFGSLPVPLSLYGQYVVNQATDSNEDTAWLTGAKTKVGDFSFDYNYRDVQRNAVVGAFTDSDFANGYTASRGHKFKVAYDIDKNFALGATYFMARSDAASGSRKDADIDTLQLDLEAKF